MKAWKKWLIRNLTIVDIVEYFYHKGIHIYLKYEKKQPVKYYAKNSRLLKGRKINDLHNTSNTNINFPCLVLSGRCR